MKDKFGWAQQEDGDTVMGYNRRERRRIGKLNGNIKIPGKNVPAVNAEKKEEKARDKAWWKSKK